MGPAGSRGGRLPAAASFETRPPATIEHSNVTEIDRIVAPLTRTGHVAIGEGFCPASVRKPPKIPPEHRPQRQAQHDGQSPWPGRRVPKTLDRVTWTAVARY